MRAPSPKSAVADLGTQFCRSRVNPRSVPSSTLRDARTRVRLCGSARACALLRMRTAEPAARRRTVFGHSDLTMSNSPSRSRDAFLRPGFATLLHSPPNEGWAERRETFGCCAKHPLGLHMTRQARRLARRLASHDAGRSPLGAPPWRFFTRGRASLTGIRAGSVTASSSQPGRSAWRAGVPGLPGQAVTSRRRRTPRLAPHSGSSLEHALNERGCEPSSTGTFRSQEKYSICSRCDDAAGGRAMPTPANRKGCERPAN